MNFYSQICLYSWTTRLSVHIFQCIERLHNFPYALYLKQSVYGHGRGRQCYLQMFVWRGQLFSNLLFSYEKGTKSLLLDGRPAQLLACPINGQASSNRFGRPLFRAFLYENFTQILNAVLYSHKSSEVHCLTYRAYRLIGLFQEST